MAPNPVSVTLNEWSDIYISCVANAAYTQRVTVSVPGLGPATFQGTGENVILLLADGTGDTYWIKATPEMRMCSILFEYSIGGGPFLSSTVQDPLMTGKDLVPVTTIMSEDGADTAQNVSILTVVQSGSGAS
jgi:hypothetical protein